MPTFKFMMLMASIEDKYNVTVETEDGKYVIRPFGNMEIVLTETSYGILISRFGGDTDKQYIETVNAETEDAVYAYLDKHLRAVGSEN